mgnify:FL=1
MNLSLRIMKPQFRKQVLTLKDRFYILNAKLNNLSHIKTARSGDEFDTPIYQRRVDMYDIDNRSIRCGEIIPPESDLWKSTSYGSDYLDLRISGLSRKDPTAPKGPRLKNATLIELVKERLAGR